MTKSAKKGKNSLILVFVAILFVLIPVGEGCAGEAPKVDQKALEVLKAMSNYLASLEGFVVRAQTEYESLLDNGQKVTYLNQVEIALKRPNRLYVHRIGMVRDQEIFYDGKTLTLFGKNRNLYATATVPSTLDEMLDYATQVLHLSAPGSDLLYSDVFSGLMDGVESGFYVGDNLVNGVKCHHIAFRNSEVDWQIWIEEGKHPIPRKYVITSKWVTGAPEYSIAILSWDNNETIPDSKFRFRPPSTASRIPFLTQEQIERLKKQAKEPRNG